MSNFTGRWFTTFGRMDLEQSGTHVTGSYRDDVMRSEIAGDVDGGVLTFRYREPQATGTGWFKLKRHGMFSGRWTEDGRGVGSFWHGHREFDGVWQTSFGPLRLVQEADRIIGFYEAPGGGRMESNGGVPASTMAPRRNGHEMPADARPPSGAAQLGIGNRFVYRLQEGEIRGEGCVELDEQQMSLEGKSRGEKQASWRNWTGRRIVPEPELQWLVVLEAHWQRMLQEKDYSLGGMLHEFFARVPRVEVRHRFFASQVDLETWCREVLYLAEPVTVVVATHGTPAGIQGHNGIIASDALIKNLRHTDNVTVLHFSACCIEDESTGGPRYSLDQQLPFPISGYAAYADWAASALVDFTYLDMILEHYFPPDEAAKQVKQLLTFAGDRSSRNCPYPAARFRFWPTARG